MPEATKQGGRRVTEIQFVIRDSSYPFVGASGSQTCTVELAEMVPRGDGRYAEFFTVRDADPERIVLTAAAHEATTAVSVLREFEHGGLFEFVVSEGCPAVRLAELGALPREVRGEDGEGRIVAEVPPRYDPSAVVETFLDETPGAELVTKREKDAMTPLLARSAVEQVLHSQLTDRQREVLRAAFEAGYYEWPRECSGRDVAVELGISSATFSEHIHAAERKLLAVMFDGPRSG